MSKCSADETPVCCCMDVGTIMDNTDCTASYSRVFPNRAEAEETLAARSQRAREVESDPCEIKSTFTEVEGGVRLDIDFVFACEAETLIFQLVCVNTFCTGLRSCRPGKATPQPGNKPHKCLCHAGAFSFSSLCLSSQFFASPIGSM